MNQIATNVEQLSEEEFDKEFDKLISTPVEQVDQMLNQDTEETQLSESPQTDETSNIEQPEEKEEQEEPTELDDSNSNKQDEDTLDETLESEDSTQEDSTEPEPSEGVDWDKIPKDEILPWEIKANGMNVKATLAELEEGFKRGMNYTQKMQELAPHRKNMYLMNENNLTTEDLALLASAKKGDKTAIAKLLSDVKVDPLDIEPGDAANYTQPNIDESINKQEFEQVSAAIMSDQDNAPIVENALQTMPNDMYEMVYGDPMKLNALYDDVKTGVYTKVMPEVIKQQTLYGVREPTIATYLKIAQQMAGESQQSGGSEQQVKKEPAPVQNNEELNAKRRSAGTAPRGKKTAPKMKYTQADLDSMDDEEFDKAFQSVIGRSIDEYR